MRLALCLLTWNEVEGCRRDVPRLERSAFEEVFAIDGGSRDGTVEYLEGEGIPVYRQREPSLNAAYHDAIERTTCDAVVVFPPKGTIDPSATLAFRKLFEGGADLVVAGRSLPGGRTEEDDQLIKPRKWGIAWLSLFTSLVWRGEGPRIRDVLHGFRGFKVDAFRKMAPTRSGLSIDLETVIRAYRLALRRCEFPVSERPRNYGETHFPIARTAVKLAAYLVEEIRRTDLRSTEAAPQATRGPANDEERSRPVMKPVRKGQG